MEKCSKRMSNQHTEAQSKLKPFSCEKCKQFSPVNHIQQQKEGLDAENSANKVAPLHENSKHLMSPKHLQLQNQESENENVEGNFMSFCERCKQYSSIRHIRQQHEDLGTIYVSFCNICKQCTTDNHSHRSQNVLGMGSFENEPMPFRGNCKQYHGEKLDTNQYPKSKYQTLVKHICGCQNHVASNKKQFDHKYGSKEICAEQPVSDHAFRKCKFCYANAEPIEQSKRPHIMTRVIKAADNLSSTDYDSPACSEHRKGKKRTKIISENDWNTRESLSSQVKVEIL